MENFNINRYGASILAGVSIGIAGTVYLKVGGVVGACMFGFGLLAVIASGFHLFTGKAQFVWGKDGLWWLVAILFGNLVGTGLVGTLMASAVGEAAQAILDLRVATGWWKCAVLAIPCGFIMTAAVQAANKGNFWVLLLGVPTFILCGFPHCIADAFYFWAAPEPAQFLMKCYIPIVFGNYLGCNLYRIAKWESRSITTE
ncbi:MAG: formate/nitrite transporter family protein [Bacteroidales bacterium]|nr:formate/nitrite transporter family protein [Bacteroidales bacterium]